MARDLAHSNEEIPPRRVVRPPELELPETASATSGGGGRVRDLVGIVLRGVDEVGKRHGRPRRAALSTFPCSGEHGNDGGQLLGGAELGHGGAVATVAQEARGARGGEARLTGRHTRWPSEV